MISAANKKQLGGINPKFNSSSLQISLIGVNLLQMACYSYPQYLFSGIIHTKAFKELAWMTVETPI